MSITGCGWLKRDVYICEIDFFPRTSATSIDSFPLFADQIEFQIFSVGRMPSCYIQPVQIFNTALATSISYHYQNKLLISSYELSFDKYIVLDGDTINAGENVLGNETIIAETDIDYDDDYNTIRSTIKFNPELTERMQFESGVYNINFQCATDDGKEFDKSIQAVFKE